MRPRAEGDGERHADRRCHAGAAHHRQHVGAGDQPRPLRREEMLDQSREESADDSDPDSGEEGAGIHRGMPAQAPQSRPETDRGDAGGDGRGCARTDRRTVREGCEGPHTQHRKCRERADPARPQAQPARDLLGQRRNAGDDAAQVRRDGQDAEQDQALSGERSRRCRGGRSHGPLSRVHLQGRCGRRRSGEPATGC